MPEVIPRIRISSSAEIAAIVPTLFEYTPSDSVVVLALDGGKVSTSMRIDIQPLQDVWAAVGQFMPTTVTSILVVVYGPSQSYAIDVVEGLQVGYEVRDAIRVHEDHWYPVLCRNPSCCPQDGGPVELVSAEMTAAIGLGPTAPTRELLRDRLAPCDPVVVESLTPEPIADGIDRFLQIHALLNDGNQPADSSVVQMLVNLSNVHLRDALITTALQDHTEREWETTFAYLCRRAPAGFIASPATAAGVLAWQTGSGTKARIAVDVALADDETYTLARLLEQILDCGMDPSIGRESLTELMSQD